MILVERIKLECKKNNLTIAYLEQQVGLSTGAISKWNTSSPSADKLYLVSNLLNVSIEYLLTGKNKIPSLTIEEKEWLDLFTALSPAGRAACIGYANGYIDANSDIH